ncbi:cyclic lactone autoinducer peptide [Caproiciproducens sp. NJN-50]|nr:cyclic lactone autoinducer peptide [Caproiciproducens sp. NJN-50]
MKTFALKLVSKVAFLEAYQSANTSCICLSYQPKLPSAAKRLRKF